MRKPTSPYNFRLVDETRDKLQKQVDKTPGMTMSRLVNQILADAVKDE